MEDFREFGNKIEGIEYVERKGAYGIAIKENQILIEKAQYGYFLPGGGVEKGESINEALVREIYEETGYEILSSHKIGQAIEYVYVHGDNLHMKKVNYFYLIELGKKNDPTYTLTDTYTQLNGCLLR